MEPEVGAAGGGVGVDVGVGAELAICLALEVALEGVHLGSSGGGVGPEFSRGGAEVGHGWMYIGKGEDGSRGDERLWLVRTEGRIGWVRCCGVCSGSRRGGEVAARSDGKKCSAGDGKQCRYQGGSRAWFTKAMCAVD